MRYARRILECLAISAALIVLTGCPASLGPMSGAPPSTDRAKTLEQQGDHAGAARIYEALARENSGTQQNAFLLLAAREFLRGRQFDDANRVVAAIVPPLTEEQTFDRHLLGVELLLARGQAAQAWQQLATIAEPRTNPAASRYFELKGRVAFASGRAADAVRAEISRERWMSSAQERTAARRELLAALRVASEHGLKIEPERAADRVVRGWLELAPLAAAAAQRPSTTAPEIESWRVKYPNHPADEAVRIDLLGMQIAPVERVAHIALLLPVSGRASSAAVSVREGFMMAYYQSPAGERPRLRVYDTAEMSAADAVHSAASEGAELIVGPLTRDEVIAVADLAGPRPAILALNFLPADRPSPDGFFQFALSPEDEARQVAKRVIAEGRRRGVALLPTGDWGARVLAAFEQELTAGGGLLLASATIDPVLTDYAVEIQQVLRISDSRARHRRLESILGSKLQFEPRRRGDIDFIFAASQSGMARLLRPQLRFHYAGDIPTYATSEAYEPDPMANEDMQGLIFPDMPWMLGGEPADSVRAAARDAWPTGGPRRNRLFAFGYDAYRIAVNLRGGRQKSLSPDGLFLDGLTGKLSLDSERRVQRELAWAQMQNGQAKPLEQAAAASQN
jgi:outer membrane PBP1 activator LpoA protein